MSVVATNIGNQREKQSAMGSLMRQRLRLMHHIGTDYDSDRHGLSSASLADPSALLYMTERRQIRHQTE